MLPPVVDYNAVNRAIWPFLLQLLAIRVK